jgi:DNA-binding transcriptional LysR family regulator
VERSARTGETAMVDDADVQRFVNALMKDEPFARAPNAELAYRLALAAQGVARMTSGYAEEFARKVRRRVEWTKPSN